MPKWLFLSFINAVLGHHSITGSSIILKVVQVEASIGNVTKNFNVLTIKHISDDLNQTYEFKIRLVKQLSPTLSSKVKQAYARF